MSRDVDVEGLRQLTGDCDGIALPQPTPTRTAWLAGDGRLIPVGELGDTHLANILRRLTRYPLERARLLAGMAFIPDYGPDEAGDAALAGAEIINARAPLGFCLHRILPTMPALIAEAEKRGIAVPVELRDCSIEDFDTEPEGGPWTRGCDDYGSLD